MEPGKLQHLRALSIKQLLRQHRDLLEADPRGEPIIRRELLVWSPPAGLLDAARAAGYSVARSLSLDGLDVSLVVLRAPDNVSTEDALEKLHSLAPQGVVDFNHIYTGSASSATVATAAPPRKKTHAASPAQMRIGLIDGGLDLAHPALAQADVRHWGCDGKAVASAHGTAVASLMVGKTDSFHGVAPAARLYAADVYCGADTGAAADQIALAMAWLAAEKVPVINISLVGPANQTLELAVRALLQRGHLLTAAVGNDGPAAPPLYPASYPGVVGVSASDALHRILPEAARGPQVMFAAPGSQMLAAASGAAPYRVVRGTSFAAPIVAGMLAEKLRQPDAGAARHAISELAQQALQPGNTERTPEAGYGIVGEAFRISPEQAH